MSKIFDILEVQGTGSTPTDINVIITDSGGTITNTILGDGSFTTIGNIEVLGNLSGGTIFSGGTDLYNIFSTSGADGNGIYDGNGTAPTNTEVTITNDITFIGPLTTNTQSVRFQNSNNTQSFSWQNGGKLYNTGLISSPNFVSAGITSPSYPLQIISTASNIANFRTTTVSTGSINIDHSSDNIRWTMANSSNTNVIALRADGNASSILGKVLIGEINTSSTGILHTKNGDVKFEGASGDNTFYMDESTERVGIGTSSPSEKLNVVGKTLLIGASDTSATDALQVQSSGGTVLMNIEDGGNVGIGTAAPGKLLDIRHSSDPYVGTKIGSNGSDAVYMGEGAGTRGYIGFNSFYRNSGQYQSETTEGGLFEFYPTASPYYRWTIDKGLTADVDYSPTEYMRLSENGLGIGTVAEPNAKVEIVDANAQLRLRNTAASNRWVDFTTTSLGDLSITPNGPGDSTQGGVFIGTDSTTGAHRLHISGSTNTSTTVFIEGAENTTSSFTARIRAFSVNTGDNSAILAEAKDGLKNYAVRGSSGLAGGTSLANMGNIAGFFNSGENSTGTTLPSVGIYANASRNSSQDNIGIWTAARNAGAGDEIALRIAYYNTAIAADLNTDVAGDLTIKPSGGTGSAIITGGFIVEDATSTALFSVGSEDGGNNTVLVEADSLDVVGNFELNGDFSGGTGGGVLYSGGTDLYNIFVDTNFAKTDLILDAARTHQLNGNALTFSSGTGDFAVTKNEGTVGGEASVSAVYGENALDVIPTGSFIGGAFRGKLNDVATGNATASIAGLVGMAEWNQTTSGQSLTKEFAMKGVTGNINITDQGTVAYAVSFDAKAKTTTANGTITNFYGFNASINNNNLGTITNFYGYRVPDLSGMGGTIPAANLRYGVYQADAGNNYFNGTVGIKTSAADTALHVVGQVKIVDGTEGVNKVFTSDVDGVGSWIISKTISTAQTTNASVTELEKIDTVTDDATNIIEVYIKAYQSAGANWGVWKRTLTVTKVSGTVTIQEENADVDRTSSGLTASSISFAVNGADIDIDVTGIAATTINWESLYKVIL